MSLEAWGRVDMLLVVRDTTLIVFIQLVLRPVHSASSRVE